jgi:hypothetical protein
LRDIGKHTLEGSRPGSCMLVHSALAPRPCLARGYQPVIITFIIPAHSGTEMSYNSVEECERVRAPVQHTKKS